MKNYNLKKIVNNYLNYLNYKKNIHLKSEAVRYVDQKNTIILEKISWNRGKYGFFQL